MEQHPFRKVDVRWRLVWGGVLVGLIFGAGVFGLSLLLSGEDGGRQQGLLAGLLCTPLLAGIGGGLIAYTRAKELKLLHGGLAVSITFGLILVLLCALVLLGGRLIGAVR